MINFSHYLNTDLGNIGVVTNFLTGFALIFIAIYLRFKANMLRVDYSNLFSIMLGTIGVSFIFEILTVPPLLKSSVDTLMATLTVAIFLTLLRDKSLE